MVLARLGVPFGTQVVRLVTKRIKWAEFNSIPGNVTARHQIYKLREQLIDRWCDEFDIPHDQPWFPIEVWETLPHEIAMNYTVADSDPLAQSGKYRPRPEGSKYSRDDPRSYEIRIKPPTD